ncbi:MAG: zinc-binding dehydrogenase [Candidatus Thermoplasmatota archaeon]|nr:zinc-binding dehydrogenase [Candidatus Thermoplasmatota archaeon]
MRAFGFQEHGGPEVMDFFETDSPEPGPGEVAIDVQAAAINHLDLWVRQGWPGLDLERPHAMGTDAAGVVASAGEGVEGVEEGDEVVVNPALWCGVCHYCERGEQSMCMDGAILGEHTGGVLQERIVVPARNVILRPDGVEPARAAAAPLVFQTAWRMAQRARLKPREVCLVPGAGGGVATAAIQIAKYLGARVITTTSTKEKADKALELGADDVLLYTEEGWGKRVYELTDKQGVDVVLDTVGAPVWEQAQRFMATGGRLVNVGATGGNQAKMDPRYLFSKQLEFIGSTMASASEFEEVMYLVYNGYLEPVVDSTFPFDSAKKAFAHLEAGEQFGKVVIEF